MAPAITWSGVRRVMERFPLALLVSRALAAGRSTRRILTLASVARMQRSRARLGIPLAVESDSP